jgi:hypothetical protein
LAKRTSFIDKGGDPNRFHRGGHAPADWATADAELIKAAIAAAADTGGALRFGYSRDKGAYAVGIYDGGEPYTEFIRPSESIDGFLRDVEQHFLDQASGPKST